MELLFLLSYHPEVRCCRGESNLEVQWIQDLGPGLNDCHSSAQQRKKHIKTVVHDRHCHGVELKSGTYCFIVNSITQGSE